MWGSMLYLLIFFSGFTLTLFATPYVIERFVLLDIVDRPDERKQHREPIPRMGGIIVYMVSIVIFFCYCSNLYTAKIIVLASGVIVMAGIVDDMKGLQWWAKFFMELLSASGMILFLKDYVQNISIFGIMLPGILGYGILLLFIIGIMNSINLMDGMDGLLNGYSLITFLIIFALSYIYGNDVLLILSAVLAGSTLGFLKYNYHPAKIFLGDTGSLAIGFFLALCSILLSVNIGKGNLDLTLCVILLGVPIIDTLKVILVRLLNKRNPFLPDRNHLHHVIGATVRYRTTVLIIYLFTFLCIMATFLYLKFSHTLAAMMFAGITLLLLSVKFLIRVLRDSYLHKAYAYFRDNIPQMTVNLYKTFYVPVSIALLSVIFFLLIPGKCTVQPQIVLIFMAITIGVFFVFLYERRKSRGFEQLFIIVNLAVFFSITNFSNPFFLNIHISYQLMKWIVLAATSFLIFSILFFLVAQDRVFGLKSAFLNKYDVLFFTIISGVIVLQNYFSHPIFYSITGKLILGFVAYLCYKIITYLDKRFSRLVFYVTFMLTLVTCIYMYLG
jgi:UDP-GlcNAc:undecaprenyl-phosphate/decaprenyl-phosphate GlcNAc-1-phosphate transferase